MGVGSMDAAVAMITGKIWLKVSESVKMMVDGSLKPSVMAKDVILKIAGSVKAGGLNYCVAEYGGELIDGLSADSRMTTANMSAEKTSARRVRDCPRSIRRTSPLSAGRRSVPPRR